MMAIQHLLDPMSKLSTYEHQGKYIHMNKIELQHMYRALDKLSEQKEEIERELFEYNYVRINKKVEVVFYDVTTIHFESVNADELRDFGYSKNGKFNEVQVMLGMIIDANGMPVGYELFKGNTFEGKTIVKILEKIKKRYKINRVIIVADRGINIKGNLNQVKEAGYGYIMAAKIKGADAALQKKVLADDGFINVNDEKGNMVLRYKIIEHENKFTRVLSQKLGNFIRVSFTCRCQYSKSIKQLKAGPAATSSMNHFYTIVAPFGRAVANLRIQQTVLHSIIIF